MEDFKFLYRLGAGSHGIVYLMKVRTSNRYIVCKSFYSKYRKYGEKEKHILSNLHHRRIIRYVDTVAFETNFYLLCEFSNYGSFADFLHYYKNREMNYKLLFSIFAQIIDGLYYLHGQNIIHRDIKPDNILFSKRSNSKILEIKISDFSLAIEKNKIQNTIVGTPYYIAPEIILRKKYDFAVDIWSLGVSFYEAIARERPFNGRNKSELKIEILRKNILSVPRSRDEFFSDLIVKCLYKKNRIGIIELRRMERVILYCNYVELKLKDREIRLLKEKYENKKLKIKICN